MNTDWNQNEWQNDGNESDRSKNQFSEENVKKRKRRRKRKTATSFLILFFCFIVMLLLTYMAGVLYMRITADKRNSQEFVEAVSVDTKQPEVITYTQEELERKVSEAVAVAEATGKEAKAEEILGGIKESLESGQTYVETLRPFYPNDMLIVSNGRFHFIPIQEDLKQNQFKYENLNILESGEYQYLENGQVISYKGIDVSKHQGEIDWQQVAEDGVEFAFIRVALRGYGTGKLVEDEYFEQNIKGALGAGINVGVYIYSQAINEAEVLEEANLVLEKIAPYKVECPVVFDVEKVSGANGRMNALTLEERTNLTLLFCQTIENAGYKPMIYHNMEMGALMLDLETLEDYDKWFAYYNQDFYYPYEYKIWQYSDKGTVKGIKGAVDLNIAFEPIWEE